MAEKSGFFNSSNGDRKYKADFFAEYFASFVGNGVFPNPSTGLQVIANNDMTVTVKAGQAWINGYYYNNDSDLILTIGTADGVLNRIDRIALQFNTVDRSIKAKVKKGTFASAPIVLSLQRDADAYELGLADIYIRAGATSIGQINITDLRFNANYCGVVHGVVDQIDTTNLFAQYDAEFHEWIQTIQSALDGDTAGHLLNMINANTTKIGDTTKLEDADLVSAIQADRLELSKKMSKDIIDDTTAIKYKMGIDNGVIYFEEVG